MTRNVLEYMRNQETARANVANETETNRHNLTVEGETHRSNLENEELGRNRLKEDTRHNKTTEAETYRSNVARETETNRHNTAVEGEEYRSNVARETETKRHNMIGETSSLSGVLSTLGNELLGRVEPSSDIIANFKEGLYSSGFDPESAKQLGEAFGPVIGAINDGTVTDTYSLADRALKYLDKQGWDTSHAREVLNDAKNRNSVGDDTSSLSDVVGTATDVLGFLQPGLQSPLGIGAHLVAGPVGGLAVDILANKGVTTLDGAKQAIKDDWSKVKDQFSKKKKKHSGGHI